jgi:rhodanese-related sulfurtransferase
MVEQMDVAAVAEARGNVLAKAVFLDVREPWEFELARIRDSLNVPMSTLARRVDEIRALQREADDIENAPVVVICHHGMRSMQCAQFLAGQGLDHLINLNGGIDAWSTRVDPAVPQY